MLSDLRNISAGNPPILSLPYAPMSINHCFGRRFYITIGQGGQVRVSLLHCVKNTVEEKRVASGVLL
jgi:hypothetical protein